MYKSQDYQLIQMKENTDNKSLLTKQWDAVLNSKDCKLIMVGNVDAFKYRKYGRHYVVSNPTLKYKKGQFALTGKQKTVFLSFDPKGFNFSNVSDKEVLFHIDLDEEEIISKEQTHRITEKFFAKGESGEDDKIEGHSHPLLINTSPVCRYHCILSMYPDEELPQIVGSDIFLFLLNTFKVLPDVRIGYNSIGAGAAVNHLHFELLYPENLIGRSQLPIETAQRTSWLKSTLINPSEQINLYTVGIEISELDINQFGAQTFVLSAYAKLEDPIQHSELANSLAFVFGLIINELIELSIPHNVLVSDNGATIYIFVRDFGGEQFAYGWLQYSGVIVTSSEDEYEIKEETIIAKKRSFGIEQLTVELVKKNIKKHLSKFI